MIGSEIHPEVKTYVGVATGDSFEGVEFRTQDNVATIVQWIYDRGVGSNIMNWSVVETRESTSLRLILDRSYYGREEDMYKPDIEDGSFLMRSIRSNHFYVINSESLMRLYNRVE